MYRNEAAIGQLVHHFTMLELNDPSYRPEAAQKRKAGVPAQPSTGEAKPGKNHEDQDRKKKTALGWPIRGDLGSGHIWVLREYGSEPCHGPSGWKIGPAFGRASHLWPVDAAVPVESSYGPFHKALGKPLWGFPQHPLGPTGIYSLPVDRVKLRSADKGRRKWCARRKTDD